MLLNPMVRSEPRLGDVMVAKNNVHCFLKKAADLLNTTCTSLDVAMFESIFEALCRYTIVLV